MPEIYSLGHVIGATLDTDFLKYNYYRFVPPVSDAGGVAEQKSYKEHAQRESFWPWALTGC